MSEKLQVLLNKWNGERFEEPWKCHVCENYSTVVNDGFTYQGYHRYICINCLEDRIKIIKEKILESKIFNDKISNHI